MSEGTQIEIPSFDDDDDDFTTTPIPFGRPQNFHFGSQPTFGSPSGSTSSTPVPTAWDQNNSSPSERSYFHARGDSFASESSSLGHNKAGASISGKTSGPGHAATSSVATSTYSAPSRKSSFASIKNAFKSVKTTASDAPPVPILDHQSYPVLRNPFSRSGSARAANSQQSSVQTNTARRRPSAPSPSPTYLASSPPVGPYGAHSRAISNVAPSSTSRQTYSRATNHSPASSIAHSDLDHGFRLNSATPPPVPRVPNGVRNAHQHTPSFASEVIPEVEPSTPAEFALRVVLTQFVAGAEQRIESILQEKLEFDVILADFIGAGVDESFDELLASLARIAQKQAKLVIDAISRWKKSQHEQGLTDSILQRHLSEHLERATRNVVQDTLIKRRDIASTFIFCRALIAIVATIGKGSLDDVFGDSLESIMFTEFLRSADLRINGSVNQRANADLFAAVLGHLSRTRFLSVTDRFLHELAPLAAGQVARDGDPALENLVTGLRHIEIKVWPPERFEEGAEFLEPLANCFRNAHGFKLKSLFADALVHMLHPVGKTAQSDVEHPQWAKAMEAIYPKAAGMMAKPRYWSFAYPLAVTSLCVSPEEFFLVHWGSLCDMTLAKLKERSSRTMLMNGLVRLIWTYLYRCKQPSSAVTSKLEGIMRHLFPPGRRTSADDASDALTYIVHYIVSRPNLDYGQDLAMELVQEPALANMSPGSTNAGDIPTSERTTIAIQAALLSLTCIEQETTPTWPSHSDFNASILPTDYPRSSNSLSPTALERPEVRSLFDRCGSIVAKLAKIYSKSIGQMSSLDPRYTYEQGLSLEEREQLVVRQHPDGTVCCFSRAIMPQLDVFRSCLETWPRCLHPSLPVSEALDILIRTLGHVEPTLAEAARQCVQRFASERRFIQLVVQSLGRSLFSPSSLSHDVGSKMQTEHMLRVQLWSSVVDSWLVFEQTPTSTEEVEWSDTSNSTLNSRTLVDEVEAGGLFLLSSASKGIRSCGLKVLRSVPTLRTYHPHTEAHSFDGTKSCNQGGVSVIDIITGKAVLVPVPAEGSLLLSEGEIARIAKWREAKFSDFLLRLLDSDNPVDLGLWGAVFPSLVHACMSGCPVVLDICRESLNAAVLRYHPMISSFAGTSSKIPSTAPKFPLTPSRNMVPPISSSQEITPSQRNNVMQWRIWIMALCACAIPMDARPSTTREHARVPSDLSSHRERMSTARGLFHHLFPFFTSDHSIIRDAVVGALGSIHADVLKTLLEDLHGISARLYDGQGDQGFGRTGHRKVRTPDRLHITVVRVYGLVARFVREPRIAQDSSIVELMLKFVRATETFLSQPDIRADWESTQLRRYFCHIVEQLFGSIDLTQDAGLNLSLYRLAEEWSPYGASPHYKVQLDAMRAAVTSTSRGTSDSKQVQDRFQAEVTSLGLAASAAMASLCNGAFMASMQRPSDVKSTADPIAVAQLVAWVDALLTSNDSAVAVQVGRKALRSLLTSSYTNDSFIDAIVRRTYLLPKAYYDVVADVILASVDQPFEFHQMLWLALVSLGRNDVGMRQKALRMLEKLDIFSSLPSELAQLETAIRSTAPNIYLNAQRKAALISASTHPHASCAILAQCTLRLPQAKDGLEHRTLECLLPWIPNIVIMSSNNELSREGHGALHNLFSITVRYGEQNADSLRALWSTLVAGDHVDNGNAVIKFLIEQATVRSNPAFVLHAKKVVAYMSSTHIGPRVFDELCSILEPSAMILSQAVEPTSPAEDDPFFVEDLDVLLPVPKVRQHLSPSELSLLFIGDFVPDRPWEHDQQLPTLLHVVFTLLDHRIHTIRAQMRRILFQVLRCWCGAYERLQDRSSFRSHFELMKSIDDLEGNEDVFWGSTSKPSDDLTAKLKRLSSFVLDLLKPVYPPLEQHWAEVALYWGNRCPIREPACRSFQIFRVLNANLQAPMAVGMMERLSNTISDINDTDHKFAKEILLTLVDFCKPPAVPFPILPQLFWCATACLTSTVEAEFLLAISMMNSILDSIDLLDPSNVEFLRMQRPTGWGSQELCIERLIFSGLRSSITFNASYGLLVRLVNISSQGVLESSDNKLRMIYAASLPWCLRVIEDGVSDERLMKMAENIAQLADVEGRPDISRIMTSLSKNRFKRKEDFLRQAVSSLRENYWSEHAMEIVTILLGCILNNESWMRSKSLQVLKLFLQHVDSRHPFNLSGSELLMPLLRLLSTEMASQAMEVLDTPMTIAGGPSASHVVRMSVHGLMVNEFPQEPAAFGTPAESGWCIANAPEQSKLCRQDIVAVVSSISAEVGSARESTSTILFARDDDEAQHSRTEPSIIVHGSDPSSDAASLGDLVNTLQDLNTFFQSDSPPIRSNRTAARFDTDEAERRVAAILSRSLARPSGSGRDSNGISNHGQPDWGIPPTPFVDLFAGSSYQTADVLSQNFMRLAEDSDGEEDRGTSIRPVHLSMPRSNGHRRNESGSDEELDSFSTEDLSADRSWSFLRGRNGSGRIRDGISPRRSPKIDRGRKV